MGDAILVDADGLHARVTGQAPSDGLADHAAIFELRRLAGAEVEDHAGAFRVEPGLDVGGLGERDERIGAARGVARRLGGVAETVVLDRARTMFIGQAPDSALHDQPLLQREAPGDPQHAATIDPAQIEPPRGRQRRVVGALGRKELVAEPLDLRGRPAARSFRDVLVEGRSGERRRGGGLVDGQLAASERACERREVIEPPGQLGDAARGGRVEREPDGQPLGLVAGAVETMRAAPRVRRDGATELVLRPGHERVGGDDALLELVDRLRRRGCRAGRDLGGEHVFVL
jgi:hypothetical protein